MKNKIFSLFFFLIFFFKLVVLSEEKDLIIYPFTAKELFIECEKWIPGETAAQQENKREVPCIRYIQSTINTYQLIRSKNPETLNDLCIDEILNIKRHKDTFIDYVTKNPSSENKNANEVILISLKEAYCK